MFLVWKPTLALAMRAASSALLWVSVQYNRKRRDLLCQQADVHQKDFSDGSIAKSPPAILHRIRCPLPFLPPPALLPKFTYKIITVMFYSHWEEKYPFGLTE